MSGSSSDRTIFHFVHIKNTTQLGQNIKLQLLVQLWCQEGKVVSITPQT